MQRGDGRGWRWVRAGVAMGGALGGDGGGWIGEGLGGEGRMERGRSSEGWDGSADGTGARMGRERGAGVGARMGRERGAGVGAVSRAFSQIFFLGGNTASGSPSCPSNSTRSPTLLLSGGSTSSTLVPSGDVPQSTIA